MQSHNCLVVKEGKVPVAAVQRLNDSPIGNGGLPGIAA